MYRYIVLIVLTILLLISPRSTLAKEPEITILSKETVINQDYFAANETVVVSGTVNGDAYVTGGRIYVDGVINGDLIVLGGQVDMRGAVTDDLRVAGGQVSIAGEVNGNVTVGGGSVDIAEGAKIAGSLVAGAGNLKIDAPIGKGVTVGAGQITLANSVNGNILAGVGQMTLTPRANIKGDLNYWSDSRAFIQEGATISGKLSHSFPPQKITKPFEENEIIGVLAGAGSVFKFINIISSLIVGLILIKLTPYYLKRIATHVEKTTLMSFSLGFIALVASPILFLILLITIIGIPVAFILIALLLIYAYLAKIFVALALGTKLMEKLDKKPNLYWAFVSGLCIYYILGLLPIIDIILTLIVVSVGIGAVLLTRFDYYKDMRAKKLL